MSQRIVSPCVGLCSTTVGDSVCRGCQRHDVEIHDWMTMSSEQRECRIQELDAMRVEVAARFLRVVDAQCLEDQLKRYRVRFRDAQPALSRVVELLRVGRDRIQDLSRYGIALEPSAPDDPQQLYVALGQALAEAGERRRRGEPDARSCERLKDERLEDSAI